MAFDWREYLALAKELAGDASASYSVEAARRAAISRAYYGAFCFARNVAQAKEGFIPSGSADDHRYLRDHFQKHGRLAVASQLNRLRQWRNNCDYEDRVAGIEHLVQIAIRSADRVVQELEK
ncbi:MAG: hypothetical protein NZQ09_12715 [Chloroflexus sp.]|nr:hypothetical protein [Chloroflexus sp.]